MLWFRMATSDREKVSLVLVGEENRDILRMFVYLLYLLRFLRVDV